MISWCEEGILLSKRRHGEGSAIIEVLTDGYGLHAGIVRGGGSRKMAPLLQPGAQLEVAWSARLAEHLGTFRVEPVRQRVALLGDGLTLDATGAICGLLIRLLPERQAQGDLYARTVSLFDLMSTTRAWPLAYLRWEIALLGTVGVALDLSSCAVTGRTDGLAYVSPKSGRAVSKEGAGEWAPRLLSLPPVMVGKSEDSNREIARALATTGFFLERFLQEELPPARARFVARLKREEQAET